jgi:hypothetical protein
MTTKSNPRTHSQFIVRTSCAKMPNSCWGSYVHVGVIEVHHGHYTPQLRDTKSQTLRWYSGRNNSGTSDRCAAAVSWRAARAAATEMQQQYRAAMAEGYCAAVTERSPNDEL